MLPAPDPPAAPVGARTRLHPAVGWPGDVVDCRRVAAARGWCSTPLPAQITGVATAGGEFSFVVRFVNSDGIEDFQTVTMHVAAPAGFADLALSMNAAPNPVVLGAPLTYTLTVTNAGPAAAAGVEVTHSIPVGATLVSATPAQGTCTTGTAVQCTIGSVASGGSASIVVVMSPGSAGFANSTASVVSAVADAVPANNTANTSTLVQAFAACAVPTLSGPRITEVPADGLFKVSLDDFNSDGNLDALASHQGSNELSLLPGDGNGTSDPRRRLRSPAARTASRSVTSTKMATRMRPWRRSGPPA